MEIQEISSDRDLVLPQQGPDGRARAAAMDLLHSSERSATSLVSYRSRGSVLVIGEQTAARAACAGLAGHDLHLSVLTPSSGALRLGEPDNGVDVAQGRICSLSGHLGAFSVRVEGPPGEEPDLARALGHERDGFDLVLDLCQPPHMERELPPPGYFSALDAVAYEEATAQIPQLVGEFDKPKYFNYNPDICAHGASGIEGCTRCLEACPTDAIRSLGDRVEVDPYLCQGGGICATACPSGAITYAYPRVSDLLDDLRRLLHRYHDSGGRRPSILFFDAEQGQVGLQAMAAELPENLIPIQVEEIASTGMDTWLSVLAYGAHTVLLLGSPAPRSSNTGLQAQIRYANAMLQGLGYPPRIHFVELPGAAADLEALLSDEPLAPAAGFAALEEKRTTVRLAMDHFFDHAPQPQSSVILPDGAPFGEVRVDSQACTLCMGCVSVCPASALADGGTAPKLLLVEANCVQCGLCRAACPENAVTLVSQFNYDSESRRAARVLNEEQPFECVVCGKPFATASVIQRMREKLENHWMFQDPAQKRRLEMCEHCRVADMYSSADGVVDPKKPTGVSG